MASTEIVPSVVIDRGVEETPPVVVPFPQSPIVNILIRAGRTAAQVFVSTLGFTIFTPAILTPTLQDDILVAAQIAGLAFLVSFIQNAGELLAKLDQSSPGVRG